MEDKNPNAANTNAASADTKKDFWDEIFSAWAYDKLNSTEYTNVTPKHSTFQKIVDYFKGAKYTVKENESGISLDIINPKYTISPRPGKKDLISRMEINRQEDNLEAKIFLNIPLTKEWIIQGYRLKDGTYQITTLTYEGSKVSLNKAA